MKASKIVLYAWFQNSLRKNHLNDCDFETDYDLDEIYLQSERI